MNKGFIFFICISIIIISCNGNKIIVERTAQELISEFENDRRNAYEFYKGKRIEVSGMPIDLNSGHVIALGEVPIGDDEQLFHYMDNNTLIECAFNYNPYLELYELNPNEIIVIQGDFDEFLNKRINKGILLKNGIFISRSYLSDKYGDEDIMRRDGFYVLYTVVGWVFYFKGKQLRMPEVIDEVFEELPERKKAYEAYLGAGYNILYTYIDDSSMSVEIRHNENIYECKNTLNINYFYLNGILIREYNTRR